MTTKALTGQQPPELESFDRLPNAGFVKQRVVQALYTCSSATLWRRIAAGLIPPPTKLSSRSNGWNVGKLRKSLETVGRVGDAK